MSGARGGRGGRECGTGMHANGQAPTRRARGGCRVDERVTWCSAVGVALRATASATAHIGVRAPGGRCSVEECVYVWVRACARHTGSCPETLLM